MLAFRCFFIATFFIACSFSSQAQQLNHIQGEVLIHLVPNIHPTTLSKRLDYFNGQATHFKAQKKLAPQLNIWTFRFDFTKIHEEHFMALLWQQPEVQAVQLNHILSPRATIPNDSGFGTQWHWMNTGQSGGTVDADVDAELAWDISTGGLTVAGDTIVIAVIDNGIDLNHLDLVDNLWINHREIPNNGIDDDGNGYTDDYYGWNQSQDNGSVGNGNHGVKVSGMVGAVGNNGLQGTGMNWNVKLMTITGGGNVAAVIERYAYALSLRQRYNETNGEEGAFVVATNFSAGINGGNAMDEPIWCAFYDTLGTYGILNACATSNNNVNIDVVGDLPTTCPSDFLISVTATDHHDVRVASAYGLEHVDFGAPGENVYTTIAGGGYDFDRGTSFATPISAGIIALMYAAPCSNIIDLAKMNPSAAALQIRQYLMDGVDPLAQLDGETVTGGRVNAHNSLQLLLADCGACPEPLLVEAVGIKDVSASIKWFTTDSVQTVDLRWRAIGAADWITVSNVNSPYLLTDLVACTEYEVQLKSICADSMSLYSNNFMFQTDGCCVAPDDLMLIEKTDSTASFTWSSILAAHQYTIQYKATASDLWTAITLEDSNNNQITIGGLEVCTNYELQIQSVCDTGTTAFTSSILFITSCGACLDFDYCSSGSENVNTEWLAGVKIGDFENISSNENGGYSDFTNLPITLAIGLTYDVLLTPEFGNMPASEYYKIWIDYNQNGVFEELSETAFDSEMDSQDPVMGTLTIPTTALAGSTRMRVTMKWFGFNDVPFPCENPVPYGEVEDYCVTILTSGPGVPCLIPPKLDTVSVGMTTASLKWENIDNAMTYQIRYKPLDVSEWLTFEVLEPVYDAINLMECTPYEYQVKSICPSDTSEYSNSFQFTTRCATDVLHVSGAELDLVLYPNPFDHQLFLDMNLSTAQNIQVEVFNRNGQVQFRQDFGQRPAGKMPFRLDFPQNIPAGIYFIKIQTKEGVMIGKILRQR